MSRLFICTAAIDGTCGRSIHVQVPCPYAGQPLLLLARLGLRASEVVALTLDEEPHMGNLRGLHFALGCNGSGVAMMTYMGTQIARKIAGAANYAGAFDSGRFPTHPLYNGRSRWFLPLVGNYLRFRDWWDRRPEE